MIAAKNSSERLKIELGDIAVLQRKWRAALKPGHSLPRYEDVMLGSLGRLADHVILLRGEPDNLELSRSGRYAQRWLGTEAWDVSLDALPPDCATAVAEAVASSARNKQPYLATAHCVRDGIVQVYDILILPPSAPFGGMENPRLSFITPTVIAGDKSLVSLIAHELAHSWSGNLVTNATWRDFWLNEDFTVYLERRIVEHAPADQLTIARGRQMSVEGWQRPKKKS